MAIASRQMQLINRIKKYLGRVLGRLSGFLNYYFVLFGLFDADKKWNKLNLCSGSLRISSYCSMDISQNIDIYADLENKLLPFEKNSLNSVICISAINYFTKERGQKIIDDVFRTLKSGGVARFAVQDLKLISQKYVANDKDFFFQRNTEGHDRFPGETMADKINSWFNGYRTAGGKHCKYFYDFETLALMFQEAGFQKIEQKKYRESVLPEIDLIDNRNDQMFFLEAVK